MIFTEEIINTTEDEDKDKETPGEEVPAKEDEKEGEEA